jgi:hypothetical protein
MDSPITNRNKRSEIKIENRPKTPSPARIKDAIKAPMARAYVWLLENEIFRN